MNNEVYYITVYITVIFTEIHLPVTDILFIWICHYYTLNLEKSFYLMFSSNTE